MFWLLTSLLPPAAANPGFDGNCCRSKLVDNKFYYLVDKRDTSVFSCQELIQLEQMTTSDIGRTCWIVEVLLDPPLLGRVCVQAAAGL